MTDRLRNAIQILEYAKKHNVSINEACRRFNRGVSYVRDTRLDYSNKSDAAYLTFLELYASVNGAKATASTPEEAAEPEIDEEEYDLLNETVIKDENFYKSETEETIEVDYRGNKIIKTVEELMAVANVDPETWKVDKGVANKYDVTMKLKEEKTDPETGKKYTQHTPATFQNFQVKLFFSRIRSIQEQRAWDIFLESIKKSAPDLSFLKKSPAKQGKKYLLEISMPDLHIGKLAWKEESGEDYDTKIAIGRYIEALNSLLNRVSHYQDEIEEILLPVGNDLFNIDNMLNKTTAGTDQRVDSRWQQMFLKAKDLLIDTINKLSAMAPVKVLMVSGNHDYQTVYYLGCVLDAYFTNNPLVNIDNSPEQRKYHEYGINMIGFTHGNEEKHQELGLIMAEQMPQMWARTRCRQMHLGHYHSRKVMKYLDVQEFQGFTVRILPSLSGTDDWHNRKGYMSMKSAVAFLYDKKGGLVAEYSHNVI